MLNIAVIDYGMGNLHSACKGFEKAGATPKITDSRQEIAAADGVVLPGVGAFDPAMDRLREHNLEPVVQEAIASGKPFFGICIGFQMLFDSSEEGKEPGLGIIPGKVKHFRHEPGITIPHMGWNQLDLKQPDHPLWDKLDPNPYVYFVHSYYAELADDSVCAATVTHGSQTVTAAIAKDNIMAVQFHPEKSSDNGLQILSNFVSLVREASRKSLYSC